MFSQRAWRPLLHDPSAFRVASALGLFGPCSHSLRSLHGHGPPGRPGTGSASSHLAGHSGDSLRGPFRSPSALCVGVLTPRSSSLHQPGPTGRPGTGSASSHLAGHSRYSLRGPFRSPSGLFGPCSHSLRSLHGHGPPGRPGTGSVSSYLAGHSRYSLRGPLASPTAWWPPLAFRPLGSCSHCGPGGPRFMTLRPSGSLRAGPLRPVLATRTATGATGPFRSSRSALARLV